MRPILILLATTALLPLAAAGPITNGCQLGSTLCLDEYEYGEGSCAEGYEYRSTRASLANAVGVDAWVWCSGSGGYESESRTIHAWTSAGDVWWESASWSSDDDDGHSCSTSYWIANNYGYFGCASDPVDPGWGHVLP